MAYGRNTRSYGRKSSPVRRRSTGGVRRPGGRTVRRARGGGRSGQRTQTVKIQLQMVAPSAVGGTGLPSEQVAEVKASRAKF